MKKPALTVTPGVPESFVSKYGSKVTGFLSGFDRLRFRATLRMLFQPVIMGQYLSRQNVLLKDFKDYALEITERLKSRARRTAEAAYRPEQYLPSARTSKEDLARTIATALARGSAAALPSPHRRWAPPSGAQSVVGGRCRPARGGQRRRVCPQWPA